MKILFIASDNYHASGAFLSLVKLASLLKNKYNHDVLVILPNEGTGGKLLNYEGIPNIIVRSFNWTVVDLSQIESNRFSFRKLYVAISTLIFPLKLLLNIIAIKKIENVILRDRFDLVHINTSWTYVGGIAASHTNTPFIWHIREYLEEDQKRKIWCRKWGYNIMKSSNKIIAISKTINNKYSKIFGFRNMQIIYNGIATDRFLDLKHTPFSDESGKINLLMVGGFSEAKGQKQAINACIRLKEMGYNNFKFRLIGSGYGSYYDELIKLTTNETLCDNIEFCGSIPNSNLPSYYGMSDIVFMCSTSEAFGRVTVEGMLSGALVIGANCAGTCEIITDKKTGLLYSNNDVNSLVSCIEYAITHREIARNIAKAGQEYALSHFTADINAENIDKCYKDVMKSQEISNSN